MINKKVSIIIPTYKRADKIHRAINSALEQTYENIEVIVVDDNDLDNYKLELENKMKVYEDNPKVKFIQHNENKNGAFARNTGFEHSEGDYICFLDDDDFYLKNRVKKSVEALENNPDYFGVYTSVLTIMNNGLLRIFPAEKSGDLSKELLLNNLLIGTGSNIFLKREAYETLKGFDTTFIRHQDIEFMLRFFDHYKLLALNEILIVKDNYNPINIPNYLSYKKVKEYFFNKFDDKINQLTPSERKQFFYKNHFELLKVATQERKLEFILEMLKAIYNDNQRITIREWVSIICLFLKLDFKIIKSIKIKRNNKYIISNLKKTEIDEIKIRGITLGSEN